MERSSRDVVLLVAFFFSLPRFDTLRQCESFFSISRTVQTSLQNVFVPVRMYSSIAIFLRSLMVVAQFITSCKTKLTNERVSPSSEHSSSKAHSKRSCHKALKEADVVQVLITLPGIFPPSFSKLEKVHSCNLNFSS